MRILSFNPHFDALPGWRARAEPVGEADPSWPRRSLAGRLLSLRRLALRFDVFVFYFETKLPALFGLLARLLGLRVRLVLQEYYCDVERYRWPGLLNPAALASLIFHHALLRVLDAAIVHSSREREIYSRFFGVPAERFRFVAYFAYSDAIEFARNVRAPRGGYVLAAGQQRDFGCFVAALEGTAFEGMIIARNRDRACLPSLPPNVSLRLEVSFEEYRRCVAAAAVVVIPIAARRPAHSLGQIALLEAMMMRKPLVVARTFHTADYLAGDEVLFYRPGDALDLRAQLERLAREPELGPSRAAKAFERANASFTLAGYLERLFEVCAR